MTNQEEILNLLRTGEFTSNEIAEKLNLGAGSVRKYLIRLDNDIEKVKLSDGSYKMDGRSYYYKATSNATERQATSDKRQTARHPPIKKIPEKKEIKKVEIKKDEEEDELADLDIKLREARKFLRESEKKENENQRIVALEKIVFELKKELNENSELIKNFRIKKASGIPNFNDLPKNLQEDIKDVLFNSIHRFSQWKYGKYLKKAENQKKWIEGNYIDEKDFEEDDKNDG